MAALTHKRTCCLRRLGGGRAGAVRFGRFLHNERVTAEEMLARAGEHVAQAARGRHVLAIQDTTELNFSGTKSPNLASAWWATGATSACFSIR